MKFLTIEPLRFHPYLVGEFYVNVVISATEEFFLTEVYETELDISPRFLAKEFGLNNLGMYVSTYLDDTQDVERKHWMNLTKDPHLQFRMTTPKGSLEHYGTDPIS